jgi:hypothetical protein
VDDNTVFDEFMLAVVVPYRVRAAHTLFWLLADPLLSEQRCIRIQAMHNLTEAITQNVMAKCSEGATKVDNTHVW